MISEALLRSSLPRCGKPAMWADALAPALTKYEINSPARVASFLAQAGHESLQFNKLVEGLNYTKAARLVEVWPKRFPTEASAAPYVGNERALANFVYANRLGNGNANSGDGFRFRGRGLIQVTGRSNYREVGNALGLDLETDPDLLLEPANAAMSAAYFWSSRGLNALADDQTGDDDLEDFKEITRRVNGALVGLDDRLALLNSIQATLA
jgi:putative chitinase